MDNFRRTIKRRSNLIDIIRDRLDTLEYDNCPIGYCYNDDCTIYRDEWHITMQSGMIQGIEEIERALRLIKRSIKDSIEKDEQK